jgi:hypothetical protein
MNITIAIPDSLIESTVKSIMANFPEASQGNALVCDGWNYDAWLFGFQDMEEDRHYTLDKAQLIAAFPLLFSPEWPKGCTPPPLSADPEKWNDWLCQADATDFDAFVQLAIFDEVIYG